MGARALGMEELVKEPEGDDDMGHLIVTGDINVSDPGSLKSAISALSGQPIQQAVAPVETAVSAATTPLWQKLLASAALLASGAGAGAGIPWLLGAFDQPAIVQPAAPAIDTDTQYELSIQPEASK